MKDEPSDMFAHDGASVTQSIGIGSIINLFDIDSLYSVYIVEDCRYYGN